MTPREALELLLRRIDYNAGHCGSMMAISDLVPHYMLRLANESLEETAELIDDDFVEPGQESEPASTKQEPISGQDPQEPLDGQEQENETDET